MTQTERGPVPTPQLATTPGAAESASRALRVVGIDVGGTKTHIAGIADDGSRRDSVVSSSVWRTGSLFSDELNLHRLAALVDGVGTVDRTTSIVAGMHGCDSPAQVAVATRTLGDALGADVTVVNDATLLGPAAGVTSCIQLIIGTGAVIIGQDARGEQLSVDGYGWLLSDHGSAPALLRESVREILRRADADTLGEDPLVPALLAVYGARDATELALAVTDHAGLTSWGGHAPLIFEHAELGSAVAHVVIEQAAERIAQGVATIVRRGAVGDVVVAGGGVIVNQPRLQEAVERWLSRTAPQLRLHVLGAPPVDGAVALALAGVRA